MELKKNYFFYELHIIQMGQLLGLLTHATKMEEGCFCCFGLYSWQEKEVQGVT